MLLAKTDHSNERIARKSGFASLPYFTTAFHREVGMTPNAYRNMQRISRGWNETPDKVDGITPMQ
jgi:AraC-like DNA-binding protein